MRCEILAQIERRGILDRTKIIEVVDDTLEYKEVPKTEELDMFHANRKIGPYLNVYSLLDQAASHPRDTIFLVRKNGNRLCGVLFENGEYEFVRL